MIAGEKRRARVSAGGGGFGEGGESRRGRERKGKTGEPKEGFTFVYSSSLTCKNHEYTDTVTLIHPNDKHYTKNCLVSKCGTELINMQYDKDTNETLLNPITSLHANRP